MEQHKAGGDRLRCEMLDLPKSEDRTPTFSRIVTAVERPYMEVEFGIYKFHGRSASNPEKKQCDMGSRGSTHQNGALHSHAKHLDIGSTG